ncbi:MAG: oxidoreductase [Actinobacteria bacterium]|nr:oxidoreductase [Actinomycetota bacterium]|tara:strand:- start:5462 stop:6154 length:693 start_codon:yes stop_codon:yes gene_type:complete
MNDNFSLENQKRERKAVIFGSSGLVGSHLLDLLLQDSFYSKIYIAVRTLTGSSHPRCEEYVIDFDCLDEYRFLFDVDDVYCCLGTTLKDAGSVEQFVRVDYDYPSKIAALSHEAKVQNLALVSSVGSDSKSTNYYLATKGKLEHYVRSLTGLTVLVFKPGLLLGKRKQFRLGEYIGKLIFPLFSIFLIGSLSCMKAIAAQDVAKAMFHSIQYPSDTLDFYYHDMKLAGNK